jgi:hypothetical protein
MRDILKILTLTKNPDDYVKLKKEKKRWIY